MEWWQGIYKAMKEADVRQVAYVPDAGHAKLIQACHDDADITAISLTTEEEGIGVLAGAWLGGDRGALNNSLVEWGRGQVTTTITQGNTWGGLWMSLNHPIAEALPIDFSAILPPKIRPVYQSQITGITAKIIGGKPGKTFRLELKDRDGILVRQSLRRC